jgi:hemolysin activation/secretion protein
MESANSPKLPSDFLVKLVEKIQPAGEPVRLSHMDRATMLLNEVPGVQANVRLSTGQTEGQTEALVQVQDKNPWDGQLTLDNSGTVSSGISRFSSQFNRYGMLGRADVGNLQYMHSQGLDYLRLGYNEPLGYSGARWGLNTEFTHYTVISGYDALDLHGPSNSLSLYVSQPWIRRRDFSSDGVMTAEHKSFKNISTFSTSQYKLDNLTSTVSMTSQDNLWRGGENNASLQLQRGFVNYDTTPSDNTEGAFTKWRLTLSRKNKINDSQALLLSYQRQWANRNLDSSEKFGIGGASSVRAYSGGETSGSEASMFTTEWQHDLEWNKQPYKFSAFYDLGSVAKYKYNDSGVANNSYSLQGVGLWIGTSIPNRWGQAQWRATWAHRLGSNPAALSTGSDADGTYYLNRFWLSASQVF